MKLLPVASHRRMPWKNGGGETVEIAVSPDGAGLDDFDWRVSMAKVAQDGPFSTFAGVDRTLSLLEGKGIILNVEGRIPLGLTRRHEPVSFPADVPTSASLISGPITDLNVMSRRGRIGHSVRFATLRGAERIELAAPTLILALTGSSSYETAAASGRIVTHDCLVVDAPASISLRSPGGSTVAVIEFRHI